MQFFSIAFPRALDFAIERKIVLMSDACSRPPLFPLLLGLTISMNLTL